MNKPASRLVKAMQGWSDALTTYSTQPSGMYGRIAVIKTGNVTIKSEELDVEFFVPFDDDAEANEAEITAYNLSKSTVQGLKYNATITIEAGYKNDTGVIFTGRISKVKTKNEGLDKITTIYAIDSESLEERDMAETSYKKGTKASYILKDLIAKTKVPVAAFKMRRDHTYKDAVKIDGGLMENIQKYAEVCGVSAYINNGKWYVRHVREGDNIKFVISPETGLLSIEEFSEEQTAEDYKETVKGYQIECILQHRIKTASIINISSKDVNGQFRVRSGEHNFSPDGAVTKIEVV